MRIADLTFEPLIDEETIAKRINLLSEELNADYEGKTPIFIGVLTGSFLFVADLIKQITIPCEVTFTKVASYFGSTNTSHKIREDIDLSFDISGRHIVIIEDIVDTGNTINYLLAKLKQYNPASISVCSLLLKPGKLELSIEELHYVGFEIENEFVVGYGLDYKELGRNLKAIYRLVSSGDPTM
ncbi:hypoxanthine phosphoribosyltransferase [Mucilaginibacter robiniae]|uniref:Hypoxanthine phosphoribosyltransferase n=1 Tax=Mucilaginibacter robiniae TaxID=2728022 RepID=A0A7L5DZ54_9SPHI|nr:hypoxanthine phosphoribosyltransferase [Mucilaginibacter robiniae]QJD96392.1 hypoxanthine phosphoribosyltransferase [Mucilaginibacter robiniae]